MAVVVDRIAGGGGVSIPVSLTTSTGATTTEGILLGTSSVATVGAQKFSPALHFQGSGWKTNATAGAQSVDWTVQAEPVQGAVSPTNYLTFNASVNGGAYGRIGAFSPQYLLTFGIGAVVSPSCYLSNGVLVAGDGTHVSFMLEFAATNVVLGTSSTVFGWSSSAAGADTDPATTRTNKDTGLSRISAGVVGVGTGAAGSVAGVISATSHMRVPLTVATLPAGATRGYTCIVTDASNPTFLATVVGGASTIAPVFYDGAAWKVG